MAEIYKGVFEDDKGNKYYAASDTESTYDTAGIPLNNGGDLSEASVNFTVSSSRKALTAKARFKALMGDIAKWLTDLGPAAFYKVADDFTTTAENYLFTARKGKQLKDEVDNLNQNLGSLTERLTYIEGTLTSSNQYFNYPSGFNYDNSVGMLLCYRKDHDGRQLSTTEIALRASDIRVTRVTNPDTWQGKFTILLYRYR